MFYHLNKSIAHCASPPTWQVLLLEVPFILLIQKEKAFSVWFSSPQPPPHYFHASPPTWQVLLLGVPFILLIYKKKGILFFILVPPIPSPLLSCLPSHLSSSSVRCAIHTSYMKRNSIVILLTCRSEQQILCILQGTHKNNSVGRWNFITFRIIFYVKSRWKNN